MKSAKLIKEHFWIIGIVIFFIYEFLSLLKGSLIFWDEAVYISMGKYIYSLGNFGAWEIIRPLGLPLLNGIVWLTGLDVVFYSRLLAIIISCLFLVVVYIVGKKFFNKEVGIISMFLVMITMEFYNYSRYSLTEIPSTLLILLSLYFLIDKKYIYAGIFSAFGMLFKFPQGLIIIVVGAWFLVYHRNIKDILKYYISFGLTVLPFLIFNYIFYFNDVSKWWHGVFRPFIMGSVHQNQVAYLVSGLYTNLTYYINGLLVENILFVFVIIGLLYFLRKGVYKNEKYNLILFAMFFYLIYFTYIINKQMRFSLLFLPYIALIAGYGIYRTLENIKYKNTIYIISLIILLSLFLYNIDFGDSLKYDGKAEIEDEFYRYFESPINGTILTNEYEVSAYGDNKYIYLYLEDQKGVNEYYGIKDAKIVVYSPRSFCKTCDSKLFLENLRKDFKEVFNKTYWGEEYYIFENSCFL